jgi:AcrR family transcriptional regulator
MPARIDPMHRRQQVIEAAFRLVVAGGIEGLSLRKVATESGLNIGSVRHYFDGHHDLLNAAAEEAGARMGRRLAAHPTEELRGLAREEALDALQALVETVMPVDEDRRDEAIVVIELIMASRTMPVFRETSERMAADLSDVLRDALESLDVPAADLAAAQLAAVIGGLTVDTVTPHGGLSVERLRTVLRAHLRMLLAIDHHG